MKHGYYIHADNLIGNSLTNKIRMQVKSFSETLIVEECILKTVKKPLLLRLINVLLFNSYDRYYNDAIDSFESPDFLYIRFINIDREYICFLSRVKELYPLCRIIVEIPTYPYAREMCSTLYGSFMYIKELVYRKQYTKYVDRFVTYSYDEAIFGVKTIQTMNGVDVESFSLVSGTRDYDPKHINLIAVAFLMRHHGYERIIEGLKEYYEKETDREVCVSIIGEGKEKRKYERLVRKYGLSRYVKLFEPMFGDDLEKMYDIADAGLAGFGFYKDGVEQVGTLKTREYLAKGLPVILGTDDRLFSANGYDYGLLFPNNNTPVNIERVVSFLDVLYLNRCKREVVESIRKFATRTIDNMSTLVPVIEYINCEE